MLAARRRGRGVVGDPSDVPPVRGGEFAARLEKSRTAAVALHRALAEDGRFLAALAPELDIVVWTPRAPSRPESSALARRIFEEAARRDLHLALAELPAVFVDPEAAPGSAERVTCLRSVLMKPEHLDWVPRILRILDESVRAALARD